MRLIVADCTVNYRGRLDAHLPRAHRLIMIKADGCVAIHSDGGAYKPMNWMTSPNILVEEDDSLRVTNNDDELLEISIHCRISDTNYDFGDEPSLQKDGVEAHLQELLAINPQEIQEGLVLVKKEYYTDIGPVDLLCQDPTGEYVAVEIKRRGEIDGVEQLTRYLEFIGKDPDHSPVRGIFVAQIIKPQAKVLAESRGIAAIEVDYDHLRGLRRPQLSLF